MPKNYYIILGVRSDSSQADIKSAYRRLAKEFHPDHYGKSSTFLTIQEAYSVLSDPVQRRGYDNTLQEKRRGREQQRYVEPIREYPPGEVEPLISEEGPVDLGDASLARSFHSYRPSFDSLFDRWFSNFTEKSHPKGERLENLTVVITLTSEQALRVGHVRVNVPARLECPGCGGVKALSGEYPVLITYPPGVPNNHSVRLSLDRYGIQNFYLPVNFRISEMG